MSFNLLLRLGTALLIEPAENCPIDSPVWLSVQKLFFGLRVKFYKKLHALLLRGDFSRGCNSGYCFFLIICYQFTSRHRWLNTGTTGSVHRASCPVSPMWQQVVTVFNEILKQKLINNFNYCFYTVIKFLLVVTTTSIIVIISCNKTR